MDTAVILFTYACIYSYQEEHGVQMVGCIRNTYGPCSSCNLCSELLRLDHTCIHSHKSSNNWDCRYFRSSGGWVAAGDQAGSLYLIAVMRTVGGSILPSCPPLCGSIWIFEMRSAGLWGNDVEGVSCGTMPKL